MITLKEFIMITERSFISLLVLFIVTKIIGKRQVSQLSLFDYVIGISIGNFAAEMIINIESKLIYGILAMFIFGILSYIIDFLTLKSIHLRRFFSGVPTILIDNGNIIEEGLNKSNIDINDLLMQARLNGYYDITKITYAIMESNGSISFTTNKDDLTANIIIDGKYMYDAINTLKISLNDIKKAYHKVGYRNKSEILLGTYNNNTYKFYKKNIKTKNYSLIK